MAKRPTGATEWLVGAVIVAGALASFAVVILQWAAITTLILAVPFAAWWWRDRHPRPVRDDDDVTIPPELRVSSVDYEAEAQRAEQAGMPDQAALWRAQRDPWRL